MYTCIHVNHKRSLTHRPSSHGWAPECPIHFVWLFVCVFRVWFVTTILAMWCAIHLYFHVCPCAKQCSTEHNPLSMIHMNYCTCLVIAWMRNEKQGIWKKLVPCSEYIIRLRVDCMNACSACKCGSVSMVADWRTTIHPHLITQLHVPARTTPSLAPFLIPSTPL